MSGRLFYVTHPQVVIDPTVPVPEWGLSDAGRARAMALAGAEWAAGLVAVASSAERKAVETAEPLAAAAGVEVEIRPATHENDRSATGYLPKAEFETVANQFFDEPKRSVRGWERAVDAQARIMREADALLAAAPPGDVAMVGHGGVGCLLCCALAGLPIARAHGPQNPNGGCVAVFDRATRTVLVGWRDIEHAL